MKACSEVSFSDSSFRAKPKKVISPGVNFVRQGMTPWQCPSLSRSKTSQELQHPTRWGLSVPRGHVQPRRPPSSLCRVIAFCALLPLPALSLLLRTFPLGGCKLLFLCAGLMYQLSPLGVGDDLEQISQENCCRKAQGVCRPAPGTHWNPPPQSQ